AFRFLSLSKVITASNATSTRDQRPGYLAAEVGEHGEDAAVVVVGGLQAPLGGDGRGGLGHGPLGGDHPLGDRGLGPALRPGRSRSRGLTRPGPRSSAVGASSLEMTSGSIAVPPPAPRRSASANWALSNTRSLSR